MALPAPAGSLCPAGSYRADRKRERWAKTFLGEIMSQFQSFFISAGGDQNQCEELNAFLKSHVIVRTVENLVSSGANCGIQILVEYKNNGEMAAKSSKRVDWRATLKTDDEKLVFDKLKVFRSSLAKEKKLVGAYMVCKDEHLAQMVQNPKITVDEIKEFPHANNIMLKEYAQDLFDEYQKIMKERHEESEVPF